MPSITVTGADERTPIEELVRLTQLSRRVEIGLLYSETPEGRNRYPSREWLVMATSRLGRRCAVHVCGRRARAEARTGPEWLRHAGRVQINGDVDPAELQAALKHYVLVITQHSPQRTWDLSQLDYAGHMLLVDASGGRGMSPDGWRRPDARKPVGFAGGLGPDNLATELPRISTIAQEPWWVDMEGKLRTEEDWFSVERAEQAIQAFLAFVKEGL